MIIRSTTHCCWYDLDGTKCTVQFITGVKAPHPYAREKHHIYFRSQYKKSDRNEPRNSVYLCPKHHRHSLHWVHGQNKKLDKELKADADRLKPKEERNKEYFRDIATKEKHKAIRKHQAQIYKESHNWLSQSQVLYREQKRKRKEREEQKRKHFEPLDDLL